MAIPRAGRLEELPFACVYLASALAAYTTGQTLWVDGDSKCEAGATISPAAPGLRSVEQVHDQPVAQWRTEEW